MLHQRPLPAQTRVFAADRAHIAHPQQILMSFHTTATSRIFIFNYRFRLSFLFRAVKTSSQRVTV